MEFVRIPLRHEGFARFQVILAGFLADDWELVEEGTNRSDGMYERIWIAHDGRTRIHYVDDRYRNVVYFHLNGENLDPPADYIHNSFQAPSRSEHFAMHAKAESSAERVHALYQLCLLANREPDEDIFECWREALGDDDPIVRCAAIDAATILQWEYCVEPLEELAIDDSNPRLRKYAKDLLDSYGVGCARNKKWNGLPQLDDSLYFRPRTPEIVQEKILKPWHEYDSESRLDQQILIAGLTGRPGPNIPGGRFLFLMFDVNRSCGVHFLILAHASTPYHAFVDGAKYNFETSICYDGRYPWIFDGAPEYDFPLIIDSEDFPEPIRHSGLREVVHIVTCRNPGFEPLPDSVPEEEVRQQIPGADVLFGYDANPPLHETGYALYRIPDDSFLPKPRTLSADDLAFLQTIIRHPDDDAPRLVYADWLEERDHRLHAKFIRLQIALANETDPQRRERLDKQVKQYLYALIWLFRGELPEFDGMFWGRFERGFVISVHFTNTAKALPHAEAIFAAAPVRHLGFANSEDPDSAAKLLERPEIGRLLTIDLGGFPRTPEIERALAKWPHLTIG